MGEKAGVTGTSDPATSPPQRWEVGCREQSPCQPVSTSWEHVTPSCLHLFASCHVWQHFLSHDVCILLSGRFMETSGCFFHSVGMAGPGVLCGSPIKLSGCMFTLPSPCTHLSSPEKASVFFLSSFESIPQGDYDKNPRPKIDQWKSMNSDRVECVYV
jgi:hypothetical protein